MRIMAVDYGDAHTGIAVSDPTGFITGYTDVIDMHDPVRCADLVISAALEHEVGKIVVGRPLNMNGTAGDRVAKAETFAALLREELFGFLFPSGLIFRFSLGGLRFGKKFADSDIKQYAAKQPFYDSNGQKRGQVRDKSCRDDSCNGSRPECGPINPFAFCMKPERGSGSREKITQVNGLRCTL